MLTPTQIKKLEAVEDPLMRRRYIKYFQLAEDLQQTIFSEQVADRVDRICQKYNLNFDQAWHLSYLIGLILLGETPISEMTKKIKEECEVDEEQARRLTEETAKEIFAPVKESLKKLHGLPSEVLTKEGLPVEVSLRETKDGLSGIIPETPAKEELPKIPPSIPPASSPSITYREPIEEKPGPASTRDESTRGGREIPVPPSNIVDLKNL